MVPCSQDKKPQTQRFARRNADVRGDHRVLTFVDVHTFWATF